jgi:hypothetical protein
VSKRRFADVHDRSDLPPIADIRHLLRLES